MSEAGDSDGGAPAARGGLERFLYVCADPGIPVPGPKGSSLHVQSVCREFQRRGLGGTVLALRAEGPSLEGVPVQAIPVPLRRRRKSREEREVRLFLAGVHEKLESDRAPDFVYERYSLWHVGGLALARRFDVPFVLEVNSPLPDEEARFRGLIHADLAQGVAQVLCREADLVICVSEEVADWVRAHRRSGDGVHVVPNGVDPEVFRPRRGPRPDTLPADRPLVAFSGSFRPWHGLDDLLAAFDRVVRVHELDAHLVCVGDGPEREAFRAKVAERGLGERVHLPGRVPQEEVGDWIGDAGVAVAPYPELEHFYFSPLKLFEFLALGTPVVATALGQLRELVDPAWGRICEPGDVEGMARQIAELLGDPAKARRMGEAGRHWVLEHATWEKRVDTILRHVEALR